MSLRWQSSYSTSGSPARIAPTSPLKITDGPPSQPPPGLVISAVVPQFPRAPRAANIMRPQCRPERLGWLHRRQTGPDPMMAFVLLRRPQKSEQREITRVKVPIVPTSLALSPTRLRRKICRSPAHRQKSKARPRKSASKEEADFRPRTLDFKTPDPEPRTSDPNARGPRVRSQKSEVRDSKSEVRGLESDEDFPASLVWRGVLNEKMTASGGWRRWFQARRPGTGGCAGRNLLCYNFCIPIGGTIG